jgi:DHA1 family bicyclomycin/chloramphenicol resistance-like MFS transporter
MKGYQEVGIHARFLFLSLAAGFNFNGFFLYIVSAPVFLGEHLELGPQQYAWLFVPGIAGIMIGSQLSGRSAGRFTSNRTVSLAYGFMIAASVANLAYAFLAWPSLPWAVIPIMVYGIGFAMAMPSISIITLDLFPTRRGMAASLQGFVSGMVNVVTAGAIAPALWSNPRSLALGMLGLMAAGLTCWWLFLRSSHARRRGPPAPPPPTPA